MVLIGLSPTRAWSRADVKSVMPSEQVWASRSDFLAVMADNGAHVSVHQLERWHKDGLLPRPKRVPLGRGRGTESCYPADAIAQAIFLGRARKSCRTLDQLAWSAWAAGYPVTPRVRRVLLASLDRTISRVQRGLDDFVEEVPGNPVDAAAGKRFPKALGKMPRKMRPTFQRVMMEIQLGTFDPRSYEAAEIAPLFVLPRHRTQAILEDPRVIEHMVKFMGHVMNAERMRSVVQRMSDERLEKQRDVAQRLWDSVAESSIQGRIPLMYGMFFMVFAANHLSGHARLGRLMFSRFAREHGFSSLEATFVAMRDGWSPGDKSPNVPMDAVALHEAVALQT
jgi:hypothetical protein